MGAYLVRRIVATIPILFVTSVFVFAVMRILPGDPVLMIAGEAQADISPEVLDRIRQEHGLDRPVYVQYAAWVRKMGTGDLGRSVRSGQPVADILRPRLLPTVQIGLMAWMLALLIGIDRFMSEARAITNLIGNALAAVVVAKWEGALDVDRMHRLLDAPGGTESA